jgi:hypothetical protein
VPPCFAARTVSEAMGVSRPRVTKVLISIVGLDTDFVLLDQRNMYKKEIYVKDFISKNLELTRCR